MEIRFTPGPWQARERDGRIFIMSQQVRHPNASGAWADVAYLCVSNGCDMNDANLIAAAPDLYAEADQCALELDEAANIFDGVGFTSIASMYRKAAERTRAALSKARGGP